MLILSTEPTPKCGEVINLNCRDLPRLARQDVRRQGLPCQQMYGVVGLGDIGQEASVMD